MRRAPRKRTENLKDFLEFPVSNRPVRTETANRTLLAAYQGGDQSAAAALFNRYLVRLTALVRSRLSRRFARRVDPDDVVLSAYRSFFVAATDGRITVPANDDLWPLLVVLVLRKLSRAAERHSASRRDIALELDRNSNVLKQAISGDPTPEQAALLDDELVNILGQLAEREREIVTLRLRGESERAIADSLDCSERTVRRGLNRVRRLIVDRGGIGDVNLPESPGCAAASALQAPVDSSESEVNSFWRSIEYGDLRLEQLIGAGGMAKLYRATRLSDGGTVAVKFLRKRFWGDRQAIQSMMNEAGVLKRLDHPQIVTLVAAGRTRKGAPFLVLPWVDGEDFGAWRARTTPTVEKVLTAMQSVLEPIGTAHDAGVIHCDLKPANLLIDGAGRSYLTDFGFARSTSHDEHPQVRGGTVSFFAPEQCSNVFGPIGVWTDVYGWGATLYAMLCGRPPYVGSDVASVIAQIVALRHPQPPSRWNSSVPSWIDAVVLRCLEKEPQARYANMQELALLLRERL